MLAFGQFFPLVARRAFTTGEFVLVAHLAFCYRCILRWVTLLPLLFLLIPRPLLRAPTLSWAGCPLLMAVVLSRLSSCHMLRQVGPTKASTSTIFRDVAMSPCFLLLKFEQLFLTSTSARSPPSRLFALVSWLLAAVALLVSPPLCVVTSTAPLLWVSTPDSTPPRAPLSPSPSPAPWW